MGIKIRGKDRYDVELRGRYVKRVYDEGTAQMLYMSGKRLLELGKPLGEVVSELRGDEQKCPTFGEYAKDWIKSQRVSNSSIRGYTTALNRALPTLKSVRLDDIDLAEFNRLIAALDGYAPASVKQTIMVVKSIMNDAADEGVSGPGARPPKRLKKMPKPRSVQAGFAISRKQAERIAANAPLRFRYMFALWPYVGARMGEWVALEWEDVDFANKKLTIERQVTVKGEITPTKNDKVRTVDLTEPAIEILLEWRNYNPHELLWPSAYGRYMDRNTIAIALSEASKKAHVYKMHPHCYRTTFASWLVAAGCDPAYVARQLGDTVGTVIKAYVKDYDGADDRGRAKFAEWANTEGTNDATESPPAA